MVGLGWCTLRLAIGRLESTSFGQMFLESYWLDYDSKSLEKHPIPPIQYLHGVSTNPHLVGRISLLVKPILSTNTTRSIHVALRLI